MLSVEKKVFIKELFVHFFPHFWAQSNSLLMCLSPFVSDCCWRQEWTSTRPPSPERLCMKLLCMEKLKWSNFCWMWVHKSFSSNYYTVFSGCTAPLARWHLGEATALPQLRWWMDGYQRDKTCWRTNCKNSKCCCLAGWSGREHPKHLQPDGSGHRKPVHHVACQQRHQAAAPRSGSKLKSLI